MAAGLPSLLVIERNLDTGQAGVLSLLPGWVRASQIQSCGHHRSGLLSNRRTLGGALSLRW